MRFAFIYQHRFVWPVCVQCREVLADAMIEHGIPEHIRSDNGPEFVAKELRKWLAKTGAKTLYIEPGSPWENGYSESFNSKMRDEFLSQRKLGQKKMRLAEAREALRFCNSFTRLSKMLEILG